MSVEFLRCSSVFFFMTMLMFCMSNSCAFSSMFSVCCCVVCTMWRYPCVVLYIFSVVACL